MEQINFMKMFMAMTDIASETREQKLANRERIVFATHGIIKPQDWATLPMEEREARIDNMLEATKDIGK